AKRQEGALLADVRLAARAAGADAGNLRLAAPTHDPAAAYLAFEKLTAVQPDCGMEAAGLDSDKNNRSGVLGCATRRNLAAMVANPSDLVVPAQASGAPFAQRRTLVIENWRKGKTTGAQSTQDDNGSSVAFISRILGAGN
nr:CpaD family pilus assembly lipoprotein [Azospirillaceae bacterium]